MSQADKRTTPEDRAARDHRLLGAKKNIKGPFLGIRLRNICPEVMLQVDWHLTRWAMR